MTIPNRICSFRSTRLVNINNQVGELSGVRQISRPVHHGVQAGLDHENPHRFGQVFRPAVESYCGSSVTDGAGLPQESGLDHLPSRGAEKGSYKFSSCCACGVRRLALRACMHAEPGNYFSRSSLRGAGDIVVTRICCCSALTVPITRTRDIKLPRQVTFFFPPLPQSLSLSFPSSLLRP